MITLQQILRSQSDILDGARVKIVRHKDGREEYSHIMKDRQALLEYQKEQGKDVFKGCDYIVSFIGVERKRSIFLGVFRIDGTELRDGKYYYDLHPVPEFSVLVDRLVIDWGNNAISWHQWYDRQPKEVIEILPQGYVGNFSGLLEFVLDFAELEKLVSHPDANFEWRQHLSSVNGIYMILDSRTGQQYIGSANGAEGIWQRWSEYVRTKTGGNRELTALMESDPQCYRHFKFSILQTLPSNITKPEIDRIERLYKEKLGSRAHGLNGN